MPHGGRFPFGLILSADDGPCRASQLADVSHVWGSQIGLLGCDGGPARLRLASYLRAYGKPVPSCELLRS